MEKILEFLNYLLNGLLTGQIEAILYILGIALGAVFLRNVFRWIVKKYGWFFGVVVAIVVCVLIYGLYTQPEQVKAVFLQVVGKIESFFAGLE